MNKHRFNRTFILIILISCLSNIIVIPKVTAQLKNTFTRKIEAVSVKIGSLSDPTKIDECPEFGTGVIVNQKKSEYVVVTTLHTFVDENNGKKHENLKLRCIVMTQDRKEHRIKQIVPVGGMDVALVYFDSNLNYEYATIGDSQLLNPGDSIHYGGYPTTDIHLSQRVYRDYSRKEKIRTILSKQDLLDGGYQIEISGEAIGGLSGSGIFNDRQQLIAIYGLGIYNPSKGKNLLYSMPIHLIKKTLEEQNITNVFVNRPRRTPVYQPPTDKNPNCGGHICDNQTRDTFRFKLP